MQLESNNSNLILINIDLEFLVQEVCFSNWNTYVLRWLRDSGAAQIVTPLLSTFYIDLVVVRRRPRIGSE